jgi:hypothetical protein
MSKTFTNKEVFESGTSEGAKKGWVTRGRPGFGTGIRGRDFFKALRKGDPAAVRGNRRDELKAKKNMQYTKDLEAKVFKSLRGSSSRARVGHHRFPSDWH